LRAGCDRRTQPAGKRQRAERYSCVCRSQILGQGTTIKIYLPQARETDKVLEIVPAAPIEGGQETVLIVEDDTLVRNFVTGQLKSLGYTTLVAGNAAEALKLIDQGATLDLLFTDVIMPGTMNGRQLAEEVVKRLPSVKVLFTSGYTQNAIFHHGRLDPDIILLPKPYRKADLARMVRVALSNPLTPSLNWGKTAVASISNRASGSTSRLTSTTTIAGKCRPTISR